MDWNPGLHSCGSAGVSSCPLRVRLSTLPSGTHEPSLSLPPPPWPPAANLFQLQSSAPSSPGLGSTSSQASCPVGVTFLVTLHEIFPWILLSLAPRRAPWLPCVPRELLTHPGASLSFHQSLRSPATSYVEDIDSASLVTFSGFQMTSHCTSECCPHCWFLDH